MKTAVCWHMVLYSLA